MKPANEEKPTVLSPLLSKLIVFSLVKIKIRDLDFFCQSGFNAVFGFSLLKWLICLLLENAVYVLWLFLSFSLKTSLWISKYYVFRNHLLRIAPKLNQNNCFLCKAMETIAPSFRHKQRSQNVFLFECSRKIIYLKLRVRLLPELYSTQSNFHY